MFFSFFLIITAITPSLIWLSFYLKKDSHPEPNQEIIKIFIYGGLITIPVVLIGFWLLTYFRFLQSLLHFPPIFSTLLEIFIITAFIEELSKYLVVKWGISKNSEFDEPIDIILYMIIAALGFAAAENIFLLFNLLTQYPTIWEILIITFGRSISAVFLHALAAGITGYFWALSFFKNKNNLIKGLVIASFLHGFYNFSIILIENNFLKIILIYVLLSAMIFFLSAAFKRIKTMKSVCNL